MTAASGSQNQEPVSTRETGRLGGSRRESRVLLSDAAQPRNPISTAQIETVASRSVGIFGVVFGLQTLSPMFSQLNNLHPTWADGMNIAVFGGIVVVALATMIKVLVRATTAMFAIVYLLALIAWPFAVVDVTAFANEKPWLWYLCTVATACAAIAFRLLLASVYTIVVPLVYGILRTLPAGGNVDLALASLDAVYAIILGEVVLIIITMLRQAALAVDVAQSAALRRYAVAVRQHATEVERVQVDSIVHDSVLTTLLSAASARTPQEKELAASMAHDAIDRLDAAGAIAPGDERIVTLGRLGRRIRAAAEAFSAPFAIVTRNVEEHSLPIQAAEAIYSATVQAMVNSMQHAGGEEMHVNRTLTLSGTDGGGCTVVIADTGAGFDEHRIPTGRLGLRVSIHERVANAGGTVRVHSRVGEGTRIVIVWPVASNAPDPVVSRLSNDEKPVLGFDDQQENEEEAGT
ncbi:sensor histidine kinase [Luethyella okanaganae]|uniref:histidine kinase n=1 Tax=Luethyella okanaganae TaxID=69372 RepID=A0ABW1VB42_9MICO